MIVRILKSIGAVLAGFAAVAVLSMATDFILEKAGILPPPDQGLWDTGLLSLALAYRGLYTLIGGWLTARLSPSAPMGHVIGLTILGLAMGLAGVAANAALHKGPDWYAIAVAAEALLVLLGGWLQTRRKA